MELEKVLESQDVGLRVKVDALWTISKRIIPSRRKRGKPYQAGKNPAQRWGAIALTTSLRFDVI